MKKIEMITGTNAAIFQKNVNNFIKGLEEEYLSYEIEFNTMPWEIDDQKGTDFCAWITYEDVPIKTNEVAVVGKLIKDVEIKKTQNGIINTFYLMAEESNKKIFLRVIVWGKIDDEIKEILSKENQVFVLGKLTTGSFINKEKRKIYTTDIIATKIKKL